MQERSCRKDLRWVKTERAIKRAFFELCRTKDPYKVTVAELSRAAEINKSTFYAHYDTILDLVSVLEEEVVSQVVGHLGEMRTLFSDPDAFVDDLYQGMAKYGSVLIGNHAGEKIRSKIRPALEAEARRMGLEEESLAMLGSLLVFIVSGVWGVINAGLGPQSLGYVKQTLRSGLSSVEIEKRPA